ncbi:MAG: hypothetical protein PV344_05650, partial [Anaplasma sp.]|nr:hypothetical protein [Anaplasma sp.]
MKNSSRKQFGQYVSTTEATFDSRKLEPANKFQIFSFGPICENLSPRKLSRLQYIHTTNIRVPAKFHGAVAISIQAT